MYYKSHCSVPLGRPGEKANSTGRLELHFIGGAVRDSYQSDQAFRPVLLTVQRTREAFAFPTFLAYFPQGHLPSSLQDKDQEEEKRARQKILPDLSGEGVSFSDAQEAGVAPAKPY